MKWADTAAAAAANNVILAKGELGYTADDHVLKIGDGVTHWNSLASTGGGVSQEALEDFVGAMVTGNTETGITVTYDDTAGKLNFVTAVTTAYTDEQAQDAAASMITAATHTGLTVSYNDGANTLAFTVTPATIQDTSAAVITGGTHNGVSTTYNSGTKHLDIALLAEDVQDMVGAMVSSNTETRIAITYDDAGGKLNAVVDAFPVIFEAALDGTLTTGTGTKRLYNPTGRTITIKQVTAHVVTAPTGAAILLDVNIGGTTVFTTQGNRPSIAISGNASTAGNSDVSASTLASGGYLTVDVDQVGSTIAGADLTVVIYGEI